MPHYAVLLNSRAGLAGSFVVRADAVAEDLGDGRLRLLREGLVVHEVPADWVSTVEAFAHARAAAERVAAHRAALVGGATIHVQESSTAAPRVRAGAGRPTAVPAEGLSIRISEGSR